MKLNNFVRLLVIIPIGCFVACSGTGNDYQMDMGEKTTVGAATGGVLGAGVGAIVGNQVGNTGSGLAIGALAGAGSGALVGSVLDQQDSKVKAQDEVLQQQERQIAAQRNEMEELRRMGSDNVSFKEQLSNSLGGTPAANGSNFQAPGQGQGERASYNWPTRPTAPAQRMAGQQYARNDSYRAPPLAPRDLSGTSLGTARQQAVSRQAENVMEKNLVDDSYQPQAHVAFAPRGNSQPESAGWVQPQIKNSDAVSATDTARVEQAVIPEPQEQRQLLGAIVEQPVDQSGSAQKLVASNLSSPECKQAVDEAGSARAAADAADKLFHYRRALRLCPENADFHNDLGQVYLSLNRKEDAKFEFQEALRIDPSHARAKGSLGSI